MWLTNEHQWRSFVFINLKYVQEYLSTWSTKKFFKYLILETLFNTLYFKYLVPCATLKCIYNGLLDRVPKNRVIAVKSVHKAQFLNFYNRYSNAKFPVDSESQIESMSYAPKTWFGLHKTQTTHRAEIMRLLFGKTQSMKQILFPWVFHKNEFLTSYSNNFQRSQ